MAYLSVGSQAPDFTLLNKDGKEISLSDYLGQKVILYFYPKDSTPGCTREACDFRDHQILFSEKNAVILGISKDTVNSHLKFAQNNELNFEILSDPKLDVIKAYGVWQLKKNYGKEYMGIVRTTYVLNELGQIVKIYKVSKVNDHVTKVLSDLQ
ncbi:MAG: thioredoxin-dependent thiol peroxidase [Erysipelotrichaceae bacterium]|nr:thioredoxin-dependent thiol peroxidase [Erysipelotrichaceae bacterium]MDD3808916.1 thioredoxin-dependent thiol peroxidase [Erysipelotrichaceae bacterium]